MIPAENRKSSKLAVLAGGFCALGLAGGGFYLSWSSIRASRESTVWVEHSQKVLNLTEQVLGLLRDTETGGRGYILTGEVDFLEPYTRSARTLEQALTELQGLVADSPEQSANAARYRAAAQKKLEYTSETIRVRRERGFEAARGMVFTREGKRRMDFARSIAALIKETEEKLLRSRAEDETAAALRASRATLLGGSLSLFLLIGSGFLLLREKEQEAAASRRALASQIILANLGDGVAVADENGKFILWNPAAEKIMGQDAKGGGISEWSKTYGIFLPDQTTPYPSNDLPMAKALRGEATDNVEFFIRHGQAPEGRWVNASGRPLQKAASNIFGGAVVIHDITEQKNSQKRLEELNVSLQRQGQELSAANAKLESFSYSVSHDLRAPLRTIAGFSKIVLKDSAAVLDASGKENLNKIIASAALMRTIIDDLIELSRISRTEMLRESVDVSALAASIVKELRETDPSRELDVLVPEKLTADGDPKLLRIALVNLIGNAWKYTSRTANAKIEIGASDDANGEAVLFVKDNGAGFDMAYSSKLFGAFQRLHTQEEFEGAGIGLTIVQRIINRHGGRIWAEGAVAKGATFFFTLQTRAA
jgi:PAS domain S-box-containing protein